MKALLDTCIILDVLQKREPFWMDAVELLRASAAEKFLACITAKSTADIYYLIHKSTHSDAESHRILGNLLSIITLLDTTGEACRKALISPVADYEDAMMMETALREGMDCIVTRNVRDYHSSPVPIYTPQDFLARLGKK